MLGHCKANPSLFASSTLRAKDALESIVNVTAATLALVRLYQQGRFPFDRLIKKYSFEEINFAIVDSETGKTIKPVIEIGKYKG